MAFYRILPLSKNVDRTIRDLGLDESYRRYTGMHSFAEGSPMDDSAFVGEFRNRITYTGLAWFYATHPRDSYMALRLSLNEAGMQRPNLGNFDVHTGYPRFHASRTFAIWSDLKRLAFDQRGPRYFFTFLVLAAAVGVLLIAQRRSLPRGAVAGGVGRWDGRTLRRVLGRCCGLEINPVPGNAIKLSVNPNLLCVSVGPCRGLS